jgi:hypothetical protein
MIIYKVFYKNYGLKKGELMGALIERRKDLRGKGRIDSGLKWARLTFGQMVEDKQAIFVVPYEVYLKNGSIVPMEKMIFTKVEYLGMMSGLDQEIKRKGERAQNTILSV